MIFKNLKFTHFFWNLQTVHCKEYKQGSLLGNYKICEKRVPVHRQSRAPKPDRAMLQIYDGGNRQFAI